MDRPIIITFSGKAQHGKDSSARILKQIVEQCGKKALKINYADYLRFIATQYLGWNGIMDKKSRTALQNFATEKVRSKYPDFWIDSVFRIVQILEDDYDYILIGDCRFEKEIVHWVNEGYGVLSFYVTRTDFESELTQEQKNI